jgi:biotin synthase
MYRRCARSGALREALARAPLDRDGVLAVLSAESPSDVELVRRAACDALLRGCGPTVYLRGLVEFSNRCSRDCHYCGIRRSNRRVRRYTLRREEVVRAARWCADRGFGSVVLQSGSCGTRASRWAPG